jgi:hypothetical protein
MKPSKCKRFCADAGKTKMVFETEKKAMTFIKFNADEIKAETGYCPTRAYYCVSCGGYHLTSRKEKGDYFIEHDRMIQEVYDERVKKMNAHYKLMELQKKS